ncbi:MAG: OmpH family outer membrane protein [Pseudomonadota bacterium]
MRRVHVVALLLSLQLIAVPAARAVEAKIGIVNMQDILDTVEEGKKAKGQLERAVTERRKSLDDQQKEYKRLAESYEKQKLVLAPSALEEKRKELETKKEDLQQAVMSAQADMQKKDLELTGEIIKKIRQVVEKIGRDGNYTMIVEKNEGGIVFNKDAADVTKQVIDEFNRMFGKK